MDRITEEQDVKQAVLSELLTTPGPGECLLCFVYRVSSNFGCDGTLRWAQGWRDLRAPRAKALERQLADAGGYCDCEIFMNGWTASSTISRTEPETDPNAEDDDWADDEDDEDDDDEDETWPDPMPSCNGAPSRSAQPCSLWSPRARGPW